MVGRGNLSGRWRVYELSGTRPGMDGAAVLETFALTAVARGHLLALTGRLDVAAPSRRRSPGC